MWWDQDESPEDEGHVRHHPVRELVRRMLPLFRPHWRTLAGASVLLLVSVGAELAGPIILLKLIDTDLAEGSRSGILVSAGLYAALFIVGAAATYWQVVVLTRMGLAIVKRLKMRVFRHVLGLSMAYFDRTATGTLLARVESDTERLQALFSEVAISILRTGILMVGIVTVMAAASWPLTVAILLLAVPVLFLTLQFFRRMRPLYFAVRRQYARVSSFVTEYVQGVPLLQIHGYEPRAAGRMSQLNQEKLRADRKAALLEYGFWGVLTTLEVVAVILALYLGVGGVLGFTVSVGTLVMFIEYTRRAFHPLIWFSEQLGFIQRAFASADRVFGVLDTPSRTPDRPDAHAQVPADWREVAFEEVSFQYDGGARALDRVSFRLRRGEKLALVGLSGGGKTTITSLLLRYYEPTEGRISVDGIDIRDLQQRAWRERLGLVLQEIHLFPGTVAENLQALGDRAQEEELVRALQVVGAEDLVERLPRGLDEPLTEGGGNLSMGERQLLSFARAVVGNPDLLVLDEATSAVDPATERRLQESVDRLLEGRTALIIAHRLATVVGADRILVLHEGRVVAEGNHAELYAAGGVYRDLFDIQFARGRSA